MIALRRGALRQRARRLHGGDGGQAGLAEGGGTLVFDEFGDIGGVIQGKLLRPVENRVYRRVGDSEMRRFLGRFVFSTNKELSGLVRRGKFREDLYTHVNVLRVVMPPLRHILREALDERRVLRINAFA